jgi:hypothetical protein
MAMNPSTILTTIGRKQCRQYYAVVAAVLYIVVPVVAYLVIKSRESKPRFSETESRLLDILASLVMKCKLDDAGHIARLTLHGKQFNDEELE